MSDILGKRALALGNMFKATQPGISEFLAHCQRIPPNDISLRLSSPEVAAQLARLDGVELRILRNLLDEVRLQGEAERLYLEAAHWDLVADRVKDELSSRGKEA